MREHDRAIGVGGRAVRATSMEESGDAHTCRACCIDTTAGRTGPKPRAGRQAGTAGPARTRVVVSVL
ncbi:hypothetical protein WS96_08850 [Burkholderia sp. MSMB1835]|nr:hypothetical protein WS96_08850 [Burkholderia sp. MSMB1835]